MQYSLTLALFALSATCVRSKNVPMTNPNLTIEAKCRASDPCLFEGRDLTLDVRITNHERVDVGFPLAYVQKTGPTIRLIDTRTKVDTYLPKNLASLDLKDELTTIAPGQSVSLEWVIMAGEVRQFGGRFPHIAAEVTIMVPVQLADQRVDFKGSGTLTIQSKDKP